MSDVVDFPSRVCRAELCELESIHLMHKITPFHVRCSICEAPAGQLCCTSFELDGVTPKMCGHFHHGRIQQVRGLDQKPSKSDRQPWALPAPEALDESILRATCDGAPRILAQLAPLVENDYGKIAPTGDSAMRRLQRRLKKLCEAGQVLQVDLGKRLFAYVSPTSRVARDVDAIREQVMENFDRSWGWEGALA